MSSPRRLLNELGLAPIKDRGQNFLTDLNLARTIVWKADLDSSRPVLEIGPGLGALTRPLLDSGYSVTAMEVDHGLAEYLQTQLCPEYPDRLRIIRGDALKVDWIEALGPSFNVIGNLPYLISTPILLKLIDLRRAIGRGVLMFQKELAQRLSAPPGGKDYGRLSVLLGYYAEVKKLLQVGPEVFYPRPQVDSVLLAVNFKAEPLPPLISARLFRQTVAAAFSRRRKTLVNALRSAFPADQAAAALKAAGIDPRRRAETLSVQEFVILANKMAQT